MDANTPAVTPSMRAHRRQFAWQILVPILLVTLILVAVAVLFGSAGSGTDRTWADVSLIWLILPLLIVALVFVTAFGFLIYALARLLKAMPRYTAGAQYYIGQAENGINKLADGAAKPVIWVKQGRAIIKSIFKI